METQKEIARVCANCKHLAKYAKNITGEKDCSHEEIGQIINSVNYQEAEIFGCNHFEEESNKNMHLISNIVKMSCNTCKFLEDYWINKNYYAGKKCNNLNTLCSVMHTVDIEFLDNFYCNKYEEKLNKGVNQDMEGTNNGKD